MQVNKYIDLSDKNLLIKKSLYENQTKQYIDNICKMYDKTLFDIIIIESEAYYVVKIRTKLQIEEA
tara:strand:- start:535 stop:732 length:198 start_codon:yes stop_codon:yes gene_type:complete